jgi:hypothetical protein
VGTRIREALRPCRHPEGSGRIFLCYRRDDSEASTGHLESLLEDAFGEEKVFRDISKIAPGEDYRDAIRRELDSCYVVLVVIGRQWLAVPEGQERARIHHPRDPVRQEVELALQQDARVRVIPVLVDRAAMPRSADLPESIARLAYRQAQDLKPESFRKDVKGSLVPRLEAPRPARFGRWGDISRLGPVKPLLVNALWRPLWANLLVPLVLLVAGLVLGIPALVVAAPVVYAALCALTLFDLEQARCVQERIQSRAEAGSGDPPGERAPGV